MKRLSKLTYLFGLSLLSGLLTVSLLNVVNGAQTGVRISLSGISTAHETYLKKLFLCDDANCGNSVWMAASVLENDLDIVNGLVVNKSIGESSSNDSSNGVIGGGRGNEMDNSSNSGIAGGSGNKVNGTNAAIGGGSSNRAEGSGGIVVGGSNNQGMEGGVVLGGNRNISNGVILGGNDNSVGKDGLAMGQGSQGSEGSFIWNDGANSTSLFSFYRTAYIGTKSGVLIGTYEPKSGVSLVVNGAVKVGGSSVENGMAGEMVLGDDGCMYTFDGGNWHILGTTGRDCTKTLAKPCEFGRVLLQQGDVVTGYSVQYAQNCSEVKSDSVVCSGGQLMVDGSSTEYRYPSCFEISSDPYKTNP